VLAHDGSASLHAGCTRIAGVGIGKRVFVAAGGPAWPYRGWMAGYGVTEGAMRAQLEALADGRSGYLCGSLSDRSGAGGEPRE
jgi:hypothetical protein